MSHYTVDVSRQRFTFHVAVFVIEPPTDVYFHVEERTLTFRSPSTNYCVHVELHDGARWGVYEECTPSTGEAGSRQRRRALRRSWKLRHVLTSCAIKPSGPFASRFVFLIASSVAFLCAATLCDSRVLRRRTFV